jgi:hypothetical protein
MTPKLPKLPSPQKAVLLAFPLMMKRMPRLILPLRRKPRTLSQLHLLRAMPIRLQAIRLNQEW